MPETIPPEIPFIRRLCGHLPEEEIAEGEARFRAVVAILSRIAARRIAQRTVAADSTLPFLDSTISKDADVHSP